jgi:hypothetical protein
LYINRTMKPPLFPTIGPEEQRRYIAVARKRRAEKKARPIRLPERAQGGGVNAPEKKP